MQQEKSRVRQFESEYLEMIVKQEEGLGESKKTHGRERSAMREKCKLNIQGLFDFSGIKIFSIFVSTFQNNYLFILKLLLSVECAYVSSQSSHQYHWPLAISVEFSKDPWYIWSSSVKPQSKHLWKTSKYRDPYIYCSIPGAKLFSPLFSYSLI